MQLGELKPRTHMRELQFGRMQVSVDFLAEALDFGREPDFRFAPFPRLQPEFLHLQHQRNPTADQAADFTGTA